MLNHRSLHHVQKCSRPSVLSCLLFVMYTTPLSTLISSLCLGHHLHADDTQLFLSFHPLNFDSSISHLQDALQHISSWMTANLLTLNSCKTEFLLIELKNQLVKIHNSSLDTSHSTRNLGFIFDEHLTFSDQITSISKACYYHNHQLRCIRPYLDSSTACTIATSIVHSKLDYCNSLYYKLPKSQLSRFQSSRSRTLLLVLSLKLLSRVISLPCYAFSTGSGSLNATHRTKAPLTYQKRSHNYATSVPSLPHLHSTSSQYSLFIRRYSCSAIDIILSKNN